MGIVFNGVVQDSSFAVGEKLNVEILESGEALQTTVGTPFSVVLPEDTLWNICVTNSDTAGAEKEKCYELKYVGAEGVFSQTLGEAFAEDAVDSIAPDGRSRMTSAKDAALDSLPSVENDASKQRPDSGDVNVDELLAGGDNSKSPNSRRWWCSCGAAPSAARVSP